MTAPDPGRRRFLGGLAALLSVAAVAGLARIWSGTDAAPPTTTRAGRAAGASAGGTTTTRAVIRGRTTTTSTSPPTTTQLPAVAVTVSALCREAWGELPVAGEFRTHTIERLTVHHTAALLETNAQAPARLRQHQRYHIDLGWPDIAYHFVVDANGHVYEGRPVDAVGDTGTDYDPTGHFLVCAEGNFDEQEITAPQLEAVTNVLAWAAATFDVHPATIRGHRDWASTSCPGDRFYPTIESGDLMAAVEGRLRAGGAALTVVCGAEAAQTVADIEAGST